MHLDDFICRIISKSRTESKNTYAFDFDKYFRTDFWTNLYYHQQSRWVLVLWYPHQHLGLSNFVGFISLKGKNNISLISMTEADRFFFFNYLYLFYRVIIFYWCVRAFYRVLKTVHLQTCVKNNFFVLILHFIYRFFFFFAV